MTSNENLHKKRTRMNVNNATEEQLLGKVNTPVGIQLNSAPVYNGFFEPKELSGYACCRKVSATTLQCVSTVLYAFVILRFEKTEKK